MYSDTCIVKDSWTINWGVVGYDTRSFCGSDTDVYNPRWNVILIFV